MPDETTTSATTAPEAGEATVTTPSPDAPEATADTLPPDVEARAAAKARREAASLRERLRQTEAELQQTRTAAERAKLDEVERAQAELADARAEAEKAAADAQRWRRAASLAGKVADTEVAVKIIKDEHLNDDGSINVDLFLSDYPYMALRPSPAAVNPQNRHLGDARELSVDDLKGMTPEQINANWERIKRIKRN